MMVEFVTGIWRVKYSTTKLRLQRKIESLLKIYREIVRLMALHQTNKAIPPDAVALTEEQAFEHQWKMIYDWPFLQVWPLRLGNSLLASGALVSGLIINTFYRRRVKLRSIAQASSVLAVVAFPAIGCGFAHYQFVVRDILLHKTPCASCLMLRSASIQALSGVIYPIVLASITSFMFASRFGTYAIPDVRQSGEIIQTWLKVSKPLIPRLKWMLVSQVIISGLVTHLEVNVYFKVQKTLMQYEEEYERMIYN